MSKNNYCKKLNKIKLTNKMEKQNNSKIVDIIKNNFELILTIQ